MPARRSSSPVSSDDLEAGIERAALTIDAGLRLELLTALRAERRAPRRGASPTVGAAAAGVTDADDAGARPRNVVQEIAERRREDIRDEMGRLSLDDHLAIAEATPPPRPILDRLAAPGLHLIAEIKRSSPSAGTIAGPDEDIVARARAYEAGGASAISVLCEPHWFGGSVDDLRAVRAAVSIPVLAKEFVVEEIQLPHLRAAGADLVLLLAVLHDADAPRRASSIARSRSAWSRSSRPMTRPSSRQRSPRGARLIGINNRDLRTLEVDTDRAIRLRPLVPDDRLVVAESGVRDAATIAALAGVGFDAALVGEALVRSGDPAAAARAFVSAGRLPADPANRAATAFVKVCGITDAEGVLAAVRSGADAIGLNLVPGTPRELTLAEAVALARVARSLCAAPPADRRDHRRRRPRADRRDRRRARPRCRPAQRRRVGRRRRGDGPPGLEGAPRVGAQRTTRPTSSLARPGVPRRRRRADPARRRRRTAPGRDRDPRRDGAGRGRSRARCRSSSPAASIRRTSPAPCATCPPSASTCIGDGAPAPSPASAGPRTRSGSRCT